jgi:hypothetical protein
MIVRNGALIWLGGGEGALNHVIGTRLNLLEFLWSKARQFSGECKVGYGQHMVGT